MISQTEIKKFEEKLREAKDRLMSEIKELETPTDFGSDVTDPYEQEADEDEELENTTAAATTLRDRMADIEIALAKIEAGTYGTCSKCGNAIEIEVLEVAPESHLCKRCKAV